MNNGKILIIEDEKSMNDVLSMLLEDEGYNVSQALDGKEGIDIIRKDIFDIIITDIKMPYADGFTILKTVLELSPETIVIMITAFGTTEDAIDAMKMGAYDYIQKPFKIDEIRIIVRNALEKRLLSRQVKTLRTQVEQTYRLEKLIGKSLKMREILMTIPKIAESSSNVLITGESGCGKELVAHAIHNLSKRVEKEFIAVNCAAFPEGLLESELFGYMRGAFTGAILNKEGLFEAAEAGSIFLDEIGDMPLNLQAKLLRVLEDGSFRRIGGLKDIKVDVRVISATNKNLLDEIEYGNFRQDLYYRLNVIHVHLPPLRERKEDIPLLIENFTGQYNAVGRRFTKDAVDVFINYPWHGNVRELKNAIERIFTFTDKQLITIDELPMEIKGYEANKTKQCQKGDIEISSDGVNLDLIMEDMEKKYLLKALELSKGVKMDAARLLHISFRQFRHRLKKYGIN
ncbi:MAG: sigma-54 dependent transcriptional regulator [Candidatus Magnetoovum sp. WYHC-5]|nr:sigma-54 dependent transcriptional regulator [Candidatus Magnetoovum sp. WYHC-5]